MEMLTPSATSVEAQLARILHSRQFRDSPRLQKFLQFVVSLTLAGKTGQIKESTIAFEVFGRAGVPDDSIVRSSARRLRARLEEYYRETGGLDPVRITIPRGSYVPEIEEHSPPEKRPEQSESAPAIRLSPSVIPRRGKASEKPWWIILAAAAVFFICAGISILLRDHLRVAHRPNIEAQELYLKGRYYWSKRTPDDLNRAVDYFTQAVVKDPGAAQAYAGLADSYNLLSEYTVMPYQEAFRRAISAARTAIKLDGSLAEAHNSLAFASFYGAWDSATAEREFRRALQLDPKYVTAHHWYATFLMSLGRKHEALAEIERAQALDPSSKSILADKGLILLNSGQIGAARALLEEIAASDPQFLSPHRYLATVYLLETRYPDYLSQLRTVALLSNDTNAMAEVEAGEKGLAAAGPAGLLHGMLQVQEASLAARNGRYYGLAQTCALLGNRSKATQYLQLAFSEHDINLLALAIDPCFRQMRDDRDFQRIVRQVGVAR